MKNQSIHSETIAAKAILAGTPMSVVDAARIAREIFEIAETLPPDFSEKSPLPVRLREIISAGAKSIADAQKTVSVGVAIRRFLAYKKERVRVRTFSEYGKFFRKSKRLVPEFFEFPVRGISTECAENLLRRCFRTPRQFTNARAAFSALFSFAVKNGWCSRNCVLAVERPKIAEAEICALRPDEIRALMQTARRTDPASVPAIALMLYAGIRPGELARLNWSDIDFEENVVCIKSEKSKTGGTRHVSLCRPLLSLLKIGARGNATVCPPNWRSRWEKIRAAAGFREWRQNVLRHTFASYHAKFFRNFPLLQAEMGHASAELLRTRYVSMSGLTFSDSERFWNGKILVSAAEKTFP